MNNKLRMPEATQSPIELPDGIPKVAQVEVRIAADAPLSERIGQARAGTEDLIEKAKWAGGRVEAHPSIFVAMFRFMEELAQRVEQLEGEKVEGVVEP